MYSDILMPFVGIFLCIQGAELFLFAILQASRSIANQAHQIAKFLKI